MYHSVTFGDYNTYDKWHLVPDTRPVVAMPELKSVTVDVPGSNGILDLSESLTKYPIYKNRTGSMKFHVLNGYEPWEKIYHDISNSIHGKQCAMVLEDDPLYFYYGRYNVTWTSNNDGTWSDIEIGYDLEPYKYFIQTSIQEDSNLYEGITVSGNTITKNLTNDRTVGRMPVVPEFIIRNVTGTGISLSLTNAELEIENLTKTIKVNGKRKYYDMILSNISGDNNLSLKISGYGSVTIVFRRMAL